MGSAVSAAPRGWSSFSGLCWSFTCSCGGVVWSHVCGPSCCSCVLSTCGVSGGLFCHLELLRALPCRVFACGFPWFCGPSSWCFLELFPMVISSRFRWLRLARGSCVLHFVQGPLPQAGAVSWHALVLVAVPPSLRSALRVRTRFLFSGPGVRLGFPSFLLLCFPSRCVTRWVNEVFLSLLIADEGLRC